MGRFDSWTDQEIAYLVSMIDACYSEGIGSSGDDASDRALELEVAAETVRRGNAKPYWSEPVASQRGQSGMTAEAEL